MPVGLLEVTVLSLLFVRSVGDPSCNLVPNKHAEIGGLASGILRSRRLKVMGARQNGAREGDTRRERERLPERPMKIVFTCFLRVRKIPVG